MKWEDSFLSWYKAPGQSEQDRCDNTVRAIKKAINEHPALSKMSISVEPHGSFHARTNVRQNSDVDVRVVLKSTFYPRYPEGKTKEDYGNTDGSITYLDFKNLVGNALSDYFDSANVVTGNKAFDVHANSYRVDADVVAGLHFRYYPNHGRNEWIQPEGFGFIDGNGNLTINWPEQTYKNGVDKNQETGERYKGVIRILKKLRDVMQKEGVTQANDIASYLIESLVWNVPSPLFGNPSYSEDIRKVIISSYNSTKTADESEKLFEVNGIKKLFGPRQPWNSDMANQFLVSVWKYLDFQ